MKNILLITFLSLLIISCEEELVDFTDVTNPNLLEEDLIGQDNSTTLVIEGARRQVSFVLNSSVTISEIASDNYDNTQTFFNQQLDNLNIDTQDPDFQTLLFNISRLRELSLFGLNTVGPADANYTSVQEERLLFYEGLSYLFAAEYFLFSPVVPGGEILSSSENYELAAERFQSAIELSETFESYIGLARANFRLGNKEEAREASNQALSIDDDGVLFANFDESEPNGPVSTIESALFQRGSFDDLQPLPILDFLDPKFSFLTADEDQPAPIFKSEEAYLILAEADLSDNNLDAYKANLNNLLNLISNRPLNNFSDAVENRRNRPDTTSVRIRFEDESDADFRSDLVLDRNDGNVSIASISGTSISPFEVDAIDNIEDGLELLYKLRQEIFIAEGIRAIDLGIKYVLPENEILLNENIDFGDPGTVPNLPSFITDIRTELDAFEYDQDEETVIIKHNLNSILTQNRSSDQVIPFF